tara:strand:- start:15 stop:407 length:393 start_codon:yes stop_codon:yes gene_type:complete
MTDLDKRKTKLPQDKSVEEATRKKAEAYRKKHGETVTKEDYNSYKENFSSKHMSKPLSFTDYKEISSFYGKSDAENASLELIMKAGLDPEKYRPTKKNNKNGSVTKSNKGAQDFRKGGMVISTVDNRKNK